MMANRLVSNTDGMVLLIEAGEANNQLNLYPYINTLNINNDQFGMNWHLRTTPQENSHIYSDANKNRVSCPMNRCWHFKALGLFVPLATK